ncbi:MAG: zf-HC2 domain-containing protein [Bacteroidota bacterium]
MDCRRFQDLISAAVDLQLSEGELMAFREHGRKCPPCWYEYEAESATKSVVRMRARRVNTPAHVAQRITESLSQETTAPRVGRLAEFFHRPFVRPAIGLALGFAAVFIFIKEPTTNNPTSRAAFASNDVILQSLTNYRGVVNGEIKTQLVSGERDRMEEFFAGITDYAVHLPRRKDCRLIGGVQNEHAGTKLAHLVYKHEDEVVYIYQACLATVMEGEKLGLPAAAKDDLARTGWFAQTESDGRTVVLWKKGKALCAAVARMSKEDLIACLASGDEGW